MLPAPGPTDPAPPPPPGRLDRLDRDASRRVAVDWPHPVWFTVPLGGLSLSANYGLLWYLVALLPWLAGEPQPLTRFLFVAVPVTLAEALGYLVKHFVGRLRPPVADPTLLRQIPLPISKSFPSSHASMAAVGALSVGALYPAALPALIAVAAVLCFSRVYLGVHYIGDVLGGLLLGLVVGGLWLALVPAPG